MWTCPKTCHFGLFVLWSEENACFWAKHPFFAKYIEKSHKTTFYFHDVTKIFRTKILSLGTNLGSPGPGSQKVCQEIFWKPRFLFILDLNNTPALVASFPFEKNLKWLRNQCAQISAFVFRAANGKWGWMHYIAFILVSLACIFKIMLVLLRCVSLQTWSGKF